MIKIGNLNEELKKILDEAIEDYAQIIEKASEETAKKTVKRLKETSPKDTGKYARSWRYQMEKGPIGKTARVYNTNGQLTHLLEKATPVANQWGKYSGIRPAQPHIGPAEEWAEKIFEEEVIKNINK